MFAPLYKIEIEGNLEENTCLRVSFNGMWEKGNTYIEHLNSIALELKNSLEEITKRLIPQKETNETE